MPSTVSQSWMDKLRRSFRSSFRRREELDNDGGGGSGQGAGRQWPADEAAVKSNNCSFEVKYLGCLEVRLAQDLLARVTLVNIAGVRVPGNAGL